jgi:hypothetical protein
VWCGLTFLTGAMPPAMSFVSGLRAKRTAARKEAWEALQASGVTAPVSIPAPRPNDMDATAVLHIPPRRAVASALVPEQPSSPAVTAGPVSGGPVSGGPVSGGPVSGGPVGPRERDSADATMVMRAIDETTVIPPVGSKVSS